jgi:hypothetical protein
VIVGFLFETICNIIADVLSVSIQIQMNIETKKDEGKFPIVNCEDEKPYYTQIWFKRVGR